ncbi:MAG: hypothetical protein RIR95_479 [Pseudomonadota bacterium]|jgi:hypothetical protein
MGHRIDFAIAGAVVLAIVADMLFNDTVATIFILHKLADLVEYFAFWR